MQGIELIIFFEQRANLVNAVNIWIQSLNNYVVVGGEITSQGFVVVNRLINNDQLHSTRISLLGLRINDDFSNR